MASRKSGAHPDPEHRDPITHAPGAHPVGVGAGAASAGAAGAALGACCRRPDRCRGRGRGGRGGWRPRGQGSGGAVNPTIEDVGATSAASDAPDRSATRSDEPK